MASCLDYNKVKWLFLFYACIYLFNFVIRAHDNYEMLHFKYSEAKDKVESDCGAQFKSAEFNSLCKEASEYLSKTRLNRALFITLKQSGYCGSTNCIGILFGTESYMSLSGVMILTISVIFLWIGFNIGKIFRRKKGGHTQHHYQPILSPKDYKAVVFNPKNLNDITIQPKQD